MNQPIINRLHQMLKMNYQLIMNNSNQKTINNKKNSSIPPIAEIKVLMMGM